MKIKFYFITVIVLLMVLSSCNLNQSQQKGILTAFIREAINSPTTLSIADDIDFAEYVRLEITNDDASLIDGVADFAITSNYIYVLASKQPRIVLFDRQGHFLRTFLHQGQGPNDFNGMIGFIQANEVDNRFYVIGNKIGVYTLEGEFLENLPINSPIIYAHHLGNGHIAAISMPLISFQDGSFGIGIFQENGDVIMSKNDFSSRLVPQKDSGFTFGLMSSPSDGNTQSVLFKMASNDTIFRLSSEAIQPALIVDLENSNEEVIRGLNIRDIKRFPASGDIFIIDIFESPRRYYLRMMMSSKYYVASIEKQNGKTMVEQCDIPDAEPYNLADVNMQLGMVGSKGYKQFPIWGRILGNSLVQVVTPYEIEMFKEQTKIIIPKELQANNIDENPIFIIYNMINNY
jgi:hypothetical protein